MRILLVGLVTALIYKISELSLQINIDTLSYMVGCFIIRLFIHLVISTIKDIVEINKEYKYFEDIYNEISINLKECYDKEINK